MSHSLIGSSVDELIQLVKNAGGLTSDSGHRYSSEYLEALLRQVAAGQTNIAYVTSANGLRRQMMRLCRISESEFESWCEFLSEVGTLDDLILRVKLLPPNIVDQDGFVPSPQYTEAALRAYAEHQSFANFAAIPGLYFLRGKAQKLLGPPKQF